MFMIQIKCNNLMDFVDPIWPQPRIESKSLELAF